MTSTRRAHCDSRTPDYAASFNKTMVMIREMPPADRSVLANSMWHVPSQRPTSPDAEAPRTA